MISWTLVKDWSSWALDVACWLSEGPDWRHCMIFSIPRNSWATPRAVTPPHLPSFAVKSTWYRDLKVAVSGTSPNNLKIYSTKSKHPWMTATCSTVRPSWLVFLTKSLSVSSRPLRVMQFLLSRALNHGESTRSFSNLRFRARSWSRFESGEVWAMILQQWKVKNLRIFTLFTNWKSLANHMIWRNKRRIYHLWQLKPLVQDEFITVYSKIEQFFKPEHTKIIHINEFNKLVTKVQRATMAIPTSRWRSSERERVRHTIKVPMSRLSTRNHMEAMLSNSGYTRFNIKLSRDSSKSHMLKTNS